MGDRAGKAVRIGFRTVYGDLKSVYARELAKSLDRPMLNGMNKSELKKLLELPVEERFELAKHLRDSVRQDEDVRFVPIENQEVRLVRECLAELVRDGREGENCEVIEA